MKILVVNSGSSSLKYQLIEMSTKTVLIKGLCDRIGLSGSISKYVKQDGIEELKETPIANHKVAVSEVVNILLGKGVISDISEIDAVGHRVVHGGEKFHKATKVTSEVMDAIHQCVELAPLHNPANIIGIDACSSLMPSTPMVAVFDTAFHQTMPEEAYLYALPYEAYEKYKIRKYGFHGTSHKYVTRRAASMLAAPIESLKIISCHLGNGASICAVKGGKSMDTSMGFTPLDGLAMGTRCGNIDPAVVLYLMRKENMSIQEIDNYLNKKSGVLGISGVSSDFRDIEAAAISGNARAKLAFQVFCYKVRKCIGEYVAVMNGLDALVFTAGVGENNSLIRKGVTDNMSYLGIEIDQEKNTIKGKEIDISTESARVRTLVVPTNEEMEIATETARIVLE